MPIAWPESMLAEALAVGLPAAVAGGVIGALVGAALASDRVPRPRAAMPALVAASLALAMLIGYGLQTSPTPGESARVSLTDVGRGTDRHVSARIELSPRDAADDARWLTVTAWQGGGFVLDKLERVEPGVYRTTKPIPVHGEWKALLRLHRGNSLQGVPIYLPRDPAIPAVEVPAERNVRAHVRARQATAPEGGQGRHVSSAERGWLRHGARDRPQPAGRDRVGPCATRRGRPCRLAQAAAAALPRGATLGRPGATRA